MEADSLDHGIEHIGRAHRRNGLSCIGRVGSSTKLETDPEVTEAYQEWENRKRLDAIDKALEDIETALIGVIPE